MVTKAIPTDADGLLEELSTPEKAAKFMEDPATWKEKLREYVKAVIARDPDLMPQLSESQERAMSDFLRKNGYEPVQRGRGGRLPMSDDAAGGKKSGGRYRAPGTVLDGAFESFGEFALKNWHGTVSKFGRDSRMDAVAKVLGEGSVDAGAALVPEEYRAEILRMGLESALVRPRARTVRMGGPVIRYPAIRDTSHASTVYGGIAAHWTPEGGDISTGASEPTFGQVRLEAKKLTGYTIVGNELMADSAFAIEDVLMGLFGEAIPYFEDDAFITGVGGAQPVGILNADALISVSKETGQAADTIVWENCIKMFARMLPASMGKAIWYAHPDTLPQLMTMSLAVGTGGSAVWMPSGVGGPPMTLLGRPIVFTEKAETVGDAGDLVFADFSYYLIGDRQTLAIESSPHVQFVNDRTVWRMIERVDGRPWVDSALTPRNGSNTMSPFVALAARA